MEPWDTPSEFAARFGSERRTLAPEARAVLDRYGVDPALYPCFRFGAYKATYVVARLGATVVLFDDVEELWGTGEVGADGRIAEWRIYGPLVLALGELERDAAWGGAPPGADGASGAS